MRELAASYDVPRSTLQARLRGVQPQHEIASPHRRLLLTEEQSLFL